MRIASCRRLTRALQIHTRLRFQQVAQRRRHLKANGILHGAEDVVLGVERRVADAIELEERLLELAREHRPVARPNLKALIEILWHFVGLRTPSQLVAPHRLHILTQYTSLSGVELNTKFKKSFTAMRYGSSMDTRKRFIVSRSVRRNPCLTTRATISASMKSAYGWRPILRVTSPR